MTAPTMDPDATAWIREEVIGSYHWAVWTGDWRTSTPANERNMQCEPDAPIDDVDTAASWCFHRKEMCRVIGTATRLVRLAEGAPQQRVLAWWPMYLAPSRGRASVPPPVRTERPLRGEQLDLFGAAL